MLKEHWVHILFGELELSEFWNSYKFVLLGMLARSVNYECFYVPTLCFGWYQLRQMCLLNVNLSKSRL